jgi:inorganic pyrophosphatase
VDGTGSWEDASILNEGDREINGTVVFTDLGGNVGIGTQPPNEALEVIGSIRMADGNEGTGKVMISDVDGTGSWQDASILNDGDWEINGTDVFTDLGGNVGIGTQTPNEALEVNGSIRMTDGNEGDGKILISDADGTASWQDASVINDNDWVLIGDSLMTIAENDTLVTITKTGKVGIGTTNPQDPLEVNGRISQTGIGESIFIGENTGLNDDLSGNRNIFIGNEAGKQNNTGNSNIGIGYNALFSNTSGERNTAIGYMAMRANTSGRSNTAYGNKALKNNTEGLANTATGLGALSSNTSGSNNTAIGANSLTSSVSGDGNTAIGLNAMKYSILCNKNVAIGSWANSYNRNGDKNTIVGYEAGRGSGFHDKSGNVFLGYRAGYFEEGNNKLYIENSISAIPLIGGDFDNDEVYLNANVGIGTQTPNEALEVNGSIRMTDGNEGDGKILVSDVYGTASWQDQSTINDGDWAINGDDIYTAQAGNVGIGVINPSEKLEINGSIKIVDGNQGNGKILVSDNDGKATWQEPALIDDGDWSNNGNDLYSNVSGNVGIGVYYPTDKLQVSGRISQISTGGLVLGLKAGEFIPTPSSNYGIVFLGDYAGYQNSTGQNNTAIGYKALYNNVSGSFNIAIGSRADVNSGNLDNATVIGYNAKVSSSNSMVLGNQDVKVAMGTSAPLSKLHVVHDNDPGTDGLRLQNAGANDNYWLFSTNNFNGDLELFTKAGGTGAGDLVGYFGDVSGTYYAVSDVRKKKDFEGLGSVLPKVLQLQPQKYHFKQESVADKKSIGLLAQEVEEIFPELVGHDVKNDVYSMNYSGFGVIAIQAIKEQQEIIENQSSIINELIKRIEKLEKK